MNQCKLWKDYKNIFCPDEDVSFLEKYFRTNTLLKLKTRSQFCGCDYTNLYNTLFYYSRFAHSEIVALITYHFTHDRKSSIIALLHDIGTPCFAHVIDYVLGDSERQESSEKDIKDILKEDEEIQIYLENDGISLDDLDDLSKYPVLENRSPRLCADRLDGVFGTCFIWLNTHNLEEISEVYNDLCIIKNEDNKDEIGFKNIDKALLFVDMVNVYAMELQGNRDKFVMQYIADIVKKSIDRNLCTLEDLYELSEEEFIKIFRNNFDSWHYFEMATKVECTNFMPNDYFIAVSSKKRNVIPLVMTDDGAKRIDNVSKNAKKIYDKIKKYRDKTYGYVKTIKKI